MKKLFYITIALMGIFAHQSAKAQGNSPATAVDIATVIGATNTITDVTTNYGAPSCANTVQYSTTNGCADGWYSVTVNATTNFTALFEQGGMQDMGAALFSSSDNTASGTFTEIDCDVAADNSGDAMVTATLAPGTYFIQVWDYNCNANVTYTVYANINDEPCNAIPLTVGGSPEGGTFNTLTQSSVAAPSGCTNGSPNGGFTGSGCADAWYSVVVPSDGLLELTMDYISGGTSDMSMAVYSATSCSTGLTQIACDGDGGVGALPLVNINDPALAGQTLYVRVWDYNCNNTGTIFEVVANASTTIYLNAAADGNTFDVGCGVMFHFYDSGGPGIADGATDYSNGEDYTVTFCASTGNVVRLSFRNMFNSTVSTGTIYRAAGDGTHALDVDAGGQNTPLPLYHGDLADYLTFYDSNGSIIAVYTGETLSYPSPGTIVSSGECLTVNFKSSQQVIEEGWEAVVECIPDVVKVDIGVPYAGTTFSDDTYNNFLPSTSIVANDQYIVTYCPDDPNYCAFVGSLAASLMPLSLNQNVDYLYVYNGEDDTSSPIAIFTGSGDNILPATENLTNITGITSFRDYTPANTSGCLTFKLVANNATNYPSWTTVSGFSLPIEVVECDLGNGGGTDCGTATQINQNGYWAATSIDDTGNGYDATYNPTGTDLAEVSGNYTINCVDAVGSGVSEITRLENTVWYSLVTPDMCEESGITMFVDYLSCQNERADDNGIQFTMWQGTVGAGDIPCPSPGNLIDRNKNLGTISSGASAAFDMFGCYDKLTAGTYVTISGLSSNTEYLVMVDGFTGQHCFFDIYVDLFPAQVSNMLVDDASAPANFCTGSTATADISVQATADVEFVYSPTAYTSIAAAQAAISGATAYNTLANDAMATSLGTVRPDPTLTPGLSRATVTVAGTDFPANTTCDLQVYNVYAVADNFPTGGYGNGADATANDCFPFIATQVVIYPEPVISVTNDCSTVTFSATCGGSGTIQNFTVVADGVTIADGSQSTPIDYSATHNDGDQIAYEVYYEGLPGAIAPASCHVTGLTDPLVSCQVPVELLYFTAEAKDKAVVLAWRTETESNNSHFVVERSVDGNRFSYLGKVNAAGTTSVPQNYGYLDTAPRTGLNYYRLKQVDEDGSYEYSRTVSVLVGEGRLATKVYPSPTNSDLTVESSQAIDEIQVFDISGKMLMKVMGNRNNLMTIDVAVLSTGVYFVHTFSGNEMEITKFVKK
jgi:hypothetical protein